MYDFLGQELLTHLVLFSILFENTNWLIDLFTNLNRLGDLSIPDSFANVNRSEELLVSDLVTNPNWMAVLFDPD